MDRFFRAGILVVFASFFLTGGAVAQDAPGPKRPPAFRVPAEPLALQAKEPEMRRIAALVAEGSTDKRVLRAYFRLWDQLFPFDYELPADHRTRALAQKRALEERAAQSVVPMATGCWSSLGPINIPGRMTAVVSHPSDPNLIYTGGADGGVWKTSNGGATWAALTDTASSIAIGALALDPSDPNVVYAGLGEGNYSGDALYGPGVMKSTDGGANWTTYPIAANYFHEMAVDPRNPSRVWGATRSGLFLSTDGGQTWNPAGGGFPPDDASTVVVSSKPGSSVVLAAIGSGAANLATSGLYRSTDNGASWALVAGPPAGGDTGRSALAQSPGNPDRIYIGFHENTADGIKGVWRSDDEGATWIEVGRPNTTCNGQCWYNFHVAVDAADPDLVYLGAVSGYGSTNGGTTWTRISTGIHVDQHFWYSPAPGQLLAANDGGLYHTSNFGASWTHTGEQLVTAQYYHITADPFEEAYVIGGTQDNGTHRYRGTTTYDHIIGGDGAFTAIDWVDTRVWYGSTQNLDLYRSRDRGSSFVSIGGGIGGETRAFIAPFALDRSNPSTVFAGTTMLYKSVDQGDNFVAISPVLPAAANRVVRSIDNCRDVPATIWVGTTDGKVWHTPDGGTNWVDSTGNLPVRSVTSIAVHPTDPGLVYVTLGGIGTGHVWKTTNAGVLWTDMSAGLPDIVHRHILMIPEQPDTLIVGADIGIYRTDDGGQTWNVYGTDLPNVAVDWVGYTQATGTVFAGTHGRGLWQLVPPNTCPLSPDFDGIDSIDLTQVGAECKPRLQWQQALSACPIAPGVRYNVYRSTDPFFTPGPATLLQSGILGTSFVDATAVPGPPYYYVVKAEDAQTGFPGPANGGREDLNARVIFFQLGDPFASGAFRDDGGDSTAWMKTGYWSVDDMGNSTPAGSRSYHSGPPGSFHGSNLCEEIATPDMVLGAGATLGYQASFNIEDEWDGVVVEISTDGGNVWTDIPPSVGYPSSMAQTQGNGCGWPATRAVFNGPNAGLPPFQAYTHDLSAYAGQTARIRWLFSTDGAAEFEGFLLDDVVISPAASTGAGCGCVGSAPDVVPNRLFANKRAAGGARFYWTALAPSGTWNLHTTADRTAIPTLFGNGGSVVSAVVPERFVVDSGSFPAGYYQVYGADCNGTSAP